jgi:hypothetical protein
MEGAGCAPSLAAHGVRAVAVLFGMVLCNVCVAVRVWVGDGGPQASAVVVLLTADSDFSQKVQRLRQSGFRVVLVRATFRLVAHFTPARGCNRVSRLHPALAVHERRTAVHEPCQSRAA